MTKQRIKARAAAQAAQTRDEVAADIRAIGDLSRSITRLETEMNDRIAELTAEYQPQMAALRERLEDLQEGVQVWCEAHRHELTANGKKTVSFLPAGEVSWRTRPPSVTVRGVAAVIEALFDRGLGRMVRTKQEINKEAVLAEPDAVAGIAGLAVVSGVEDFVIVPAELDT